MDETMQMSKPVCGSEKQAGEYDVALHTVGLFLVLGASCFGAGFPVAAKKIKWLKVPKSVFFACKHFGTGVLVATAFVHLLPTAFGSLSDPCLPDLFIKDYPPMPGVIMMASLFSLFLIELYLHNKMGGHSHGGATGYEEPLSTNVGKSVPVRSDSSSSYDVEYEKKMAQQDYGLNRFQPPVESHARMTNTDGAVQSQMPPWFAVFYEQYIRQQIEMANMLRNPAPRSYSPRVAEKEVKKPVALTDSPFFDEEGNQVDPLVYRKMSLNITLLEGGILFHSVFVGMTVSITIDGFIILLIAILFHQMFEGLGLGSRIAAVPYPKGSIRPWILVFAFGTTAPIGQAIGLITRNSYDPNSAFGLIIVGVFNAISAGLLIFAATVDLLAQDFLSEESDQLSIKQKIVAFAYVMAGAAGMSIVGAFA